MLHGITSALARQGAHLRHRAWRLLGALALLGLAATAAAATIALLVGAFYLFVSTRMPVWLAMTSTAGVTLILSVALWIGARALGSGESKPPQQETSPGDADPASELGKSVGSAVSQLGLRPTDVVIAAAVVGLLAGTRRDRARRRDEPEGD